MSVICFPLKNQCPNPFLRMCAAVFGRDFTFIGEEYRVQVGGQDFYIDLLFYNRALSCLVPIELKIGKFKPEHIGQINFYLEALDRDVKRPNENPSVGVILCAGKDDAVVEYALSRSISPTLVSDYTLHLPDKKLLQSKQRIDEDSDLCLCLQSVPGIGGRGGMGLEFDCGPRARSLGDHRRKTSSRHRVVSCRESQSESSFLLHQEDSVFPIYRSAFQTDATAGVAGLFLLAAQRI